MSLIPILRRTTPSQSSTYICHQCRHATLLRRPKRPYTFTQLVTLSDGSTYTQRTTSPAPVYKSTKDQRNTPLWNPSSQKLMNIEADDAGRLRAFRQRFGRGWDAKTNVEDEEEESDEGVEGQGSDSLMDLISGYEQEDMPAEEPAKGPEKTVVRGVEALKAAIDSEKGMGKGGKRG